MLDIGCGSKPTGDVNVDSFKQGWNPQEGDQKKGVFVDPKKIPNFVVADAHHLPFKDNSFNVAFSSHTVEHLTHPTKMLKEMSRVTKRKVIVRYPHRKGTGAKRLFHIQFLDENYFEVVATKLGLIPRSFVRAFDYPVSEKIKRLCPIPVLDTMQKSIGFRALRHSERRLQRMGFIKTPFEFETHFKKQAVPMNGQNGVPIVYVVVYNNPAVFETCFKNTPYIHDEKIMAVFNRKNKGLPKIFNSIIKRFRHQPTWLVFCHQDFILQESLQPILKEKDVSTVYGVIGARMGTSTLIGQITQTDGSLIGSRITKDVFVDSLDEMCLIIHSDLFNKLWFDEQFRFNFYGADVCLQAYNLGLDVMATQVNCQHKSRTFTGDIGSKSYLEDLNRFKHKWKKNLPFKTVTRTVEK